MVWQLGGEGAKRIAEPLERGECFLVRHPPTTLAGQLPSTELGAAAGLANQVIQSKVVLNAPCREPIDVDRIGQVPRRLVSQL
jgi:hypothetical protein